MKNNASFGKRIISWLLVAAFLFSSIMPAGITAKAEEVQTQQEIVPDEFPNVPDGENIWRVTGGNPDNGPALGGWNEKSEETIMSHVVSKYYAKSFVLDAGDYAFKITKNGEWDGFNNNGGNFTFKLTERTKVNFYVNEDMPEGKKVYSNIGGMESQGIAKYTPKREQKDWPRLVGKLPNQPEWSPSESTLFMTDYFFDDSVYKIQMAMPAGNYESKVVCGSDWGDDFGANGSDLKTKILDAANVIFTANMAEKNLSDNASSSDSSYDGKIDTEALYFNSKESTYKNPFGAIPCAEEDVTFRFKAKAGDAQMIKLELINESDVSTQYVMNIATTVDGKDYWEVTVPKKEFSKIGIWGYKFIILDGSTKVEYGDDASSGGTGAFSEEGQMPYNLTVYASDFKTPDWMKNAVVYQLFPDRFYDGDASNNKAKTLDGTRGNDIQLFDGAAGSAGKWSDYPENPRQSEEANKPYYPNATTDGIWSNEFYGGDIEGIIKKIDYLKTLGVTAIYMNPVAWASSNHKYDATDYRHLDPMFGEPVYNKAGDPASGLNYEKTKEASDKVFERLSKICTEQGIQLITDGVFNHVGDDSIYFDRYENYPEIGAYEYWKRVWDYVETELKTAPVDASKEQKAAAEKAVKAKYKETKNPATGKNYTDADFNYISWFDVGPEKVVDLDTNKLYYEYEGWWGYNSLPVVKAVTEEDTNITNDASSTITGAHEYNNVTFREEVIGYDLTKSKDAQTDVQKANSQRWLYMGSSGWRLDVAPDVSNETWEQFRVAVKSAKGLKNANGTEIAEPIILGEEWNVATHYLLGNMFDSVMNYQFRAALQSYIINEKDAGSVNEALETIRENYPEEAWYAMLNLVDSHDTVRNLTKIDNPTWEEENTKTAEDATDNAIELQALTAIFQMSYPGAPTIYYGDEVGVTGTKDPDSRRTFPWERVTKNADGSYKISTEAEGKYGKLFNTYVTAANVRNENKEIFATGDIKTAFAKGSVLSYARKSDKKAGLSVINTSKEEVTFTADVKDFLPDGITLIDQLGTKLAGTVTGGAIEITVPGRTGLMMVSATELSELPLAPAGLKAAETNGADAFVTLTWNEVADADEYEVYRSVLDGMQPVKLDTVTTLTYKDEDVKEGTRYYYYIKTKKGSLTSNYSKTASAVPSFDITQLTKPTKADTMEIAVGKKTSEISTTISVPGLAEDKALSVSLVYYMVGEEGNLLETKMRTEDGLNPDGMTYKASFEPTKEGTYHYYVKATVNSGATYEQSEEEMLVVTMKEDVLTLEEFELKDIAVESNRVQLDFSVKNSEKAAGFEVYRKEKAGDYKKIAAIGKDIRTYIDYSVSNDTTYTYKIEAYNTSYNRMATAEKSVTPKLTMVTVTMRLHIPASAQVEATDTIYIASDVNGWNEKGWGMKKPSGATDNNIVEYTFTMMAGKAFNYKYTRGAWDKEAFTSRIEGDTTSPGNYAYSSTDTNIKAVVKNEGQNKMMIDDYTLRWKDMPLMINIPRKSYVRNDKITYSTEDASFTLQGSVPKGVAFTINDTDINHYLDGVQGMDVNGNVRLENIPLKVGENTFVLHIEPTQETIDQEWFTDKGRVEQATDTKTFIITRTGDDNNNDKWGQAPIPTVKPDEKPEDNKNEKSEQIELELKNTKNVNISTKSILAEKQKDGFFYNKEGKKISNSIVKTESGERFILNKAGVNYVNTMVEAAKNTKFIVDEKGSIITGSFVITNNAKYYTTKSSGKVVTSKLFKVNGKKYYAGKTGKLTISKWIVSGSKKYYCNSEGIVTKTKQIKKTQTK